MEIKKGQKVKLSDIGCNDKFTVLIDVKCPGSVIDIACFGVDSNNNLSDDRYMIFYNQTMSPSAEIMLTKSDVEKFTIDVSKLPASVTKLVFTAVIDGSSTMKDISFGKMSVEGAEYTFSGVDFNQEKAVIIGEIYKKEGMWRFGTVGQGFNEGMAALVRYFGGEVESENKAEVANQKEAILLKKIDEKAPALISLVKQATISLKKAGLDDHKAKVGIVLDISGSMNKLYKSGLVQAFAERILALGCKFDDDMEIDVFLFGKHAHHVEPMTLSNSHNHINNLMRVHSLEGDTRYGEAISAVRKFYFPDSNGDERKSIHSASMPVYIMFLTDGSTSDESKCKKQMRWSSNEPIFFQFIGIGKGKKAKAKRFFDSASDFPFLEQLDSLDGRLADNANYFSVSSPDEHSDDELYDLLMTEYPSWVKNAKKLGILI